MASCAAGTGVLEAAATEATGGGWLVDIAETGVAAGGSAMS